MTLHDLLVDEIRDLYHAEKQLTKALPKMAKAASHDELRAAFETHLDETREQISRLEQVFELMEEKVKAKPCAGMAGILEEGSDMMKEDAEGAVMDAGLIASAQRAEHYEITAYGTCCEWARLLGLDEVATLLQQTLDEEKATDKKLTELAEGEINQAAVSQDASDDDDEDQDDDSEEDDEATEDEDAPATAARGRSSAKSAGGSAKRGSSRAAAAPSRGSGKRR